MDKFAKRKYIIISIFLFIAITFTIKLFMLQVVDPSYKENADRNAIRRFINHPARGLIYDRNGKLLVHNKAAYDLRVIPNDMRKFDTIEFCNLLNIERAELIDGIQKAKKYSRHKSSVVVRQLSPEIYAGMQEKLFKYPGFYVETRTLREYPHNISAHMLGYVGEVNARIVAEDPYYVQGDYIGVTGLEKTYEEELRGKKGVSFLLVDVHNSEKGAYLNGQNDTMAILGKNLITTVDINLQEYAQLLLANKIGAVVAIEPKTGEVLCYHSSPSYDPNLLVGRERGKNFVALSNDSLEPFLNRAITARYSPGSTFKMISALAALQEKAITEYTAFSCDGRASLPIRCTHSHTSPLQLRVAIRESCNPYFMGVFRSVLGKYPRAEVGYSVWRNHLLSFGVGRRLGADFFGQTAGWIPEASHYDSVYVGRWNAMTVRSLAIGQGEAILTPLQMVNTVVAIANKGYYIEPHLVKAIEEIDGTRTELKFERKATTINAEYFEPIIDGMRMVVDRQDREYNIPDIEFCGKTGTTQNHFGSDHSAFIGFAPKDDPKIAIVVYIEHGGFGATYAVPIASLIVEKYLNDSITSPIRKEIEKKMIAKNLQSKYNPR